MFTSKIKTPIHVSVLLCLLALIGIIHFYVGWIAQGPADLFAGLVKEGDGLVHLFSANGSRQFAIAMLLLVGAVTRHPHLVLSGLFLRIICEGLDIVLYGAILRQTGAALVAAVLLVWEIGAVFHIFRCLKGAI